MPELMKRKAKLKTAIKLFMSRWKVVREGGTAGHPALLSSRVGSRLGKKGGVSVLKLKIKCC